MKLKETKLETDLCTEEIFFSKFFLKIRQKQKRKEKKSL